MDNFIDFTDMVSLYNFPGVYVDENSIAELARQLFPTEAGAIDFIFKTNLGSDKACINWLNKLLRPYVPRAFETMFSTPDRINSFAIALFSSAGIQIPEDYHAKQLATLTEKLNAESVLFLPPAQVISTLKGLQRWLFKDSFCYKSDLSYLLATRLESIKDEVKAALADDVETKQELQKMVTEPEYMSVPMKSFLAFVSAD